MMDLRKLLSAATKVKTPEDLDQTITDARLEGFRIDAEIERLTNERPRILLEEDDTFLEKHDAVIAAAKRQRERADEVIAELERKAAASAERQVEIANLKFCDETIRERDALEAWLRDEYPRHAEAIAKGLERIKAFELQTAEANRRLPPGTAPFLDAEWTVRRPPGSEPALPLAQTVNLPGLIGGDVNFWPRNTIR